MEVLELSEPVEDKLKQNETQNNEVKILNDEEDQNLSRNMQQTKDVIKEVDAEDYMISDFAKSGFHSPSCGGSDFEKTVALDFDFDFRTTSSRSKGKPDIYPFSDSEVDYSTTKAIHRSVSGIPNITIGQEDARQERNMINSKPLPLSGSLSEVHLEFALVDNVIHGSKFEVEFDNNIMPNSEFLKNTALLYHPNALFRINKKYYYTFSVLAPLLVSTLINGETLSEQATNSVIQDASKIFVKGFTDSKRKAHNDSYWKNCK